jgi:putative ABC transport system permease protein
VSVGGVSAAAFTGNLPTPVQKIAHDTVGAPAVHHGRPAGTPNGPDATGKAAFGLCTAYTAAQQSELMLAGSVARARMQTLLFRIFLSIAATVIIAQIVYTMTLEKLKPIALLKLIGTPTRTIVALVLQESLALGLIAYAVALVVGSLTYDKWPRLVLVETGDKLTLLGIVVGICVVASAIGIRRALRVEAGAALSG